MDPSKNKSELKDRTDDLIRLRASNEVVKRGQAAYYAALRGRVANDEEATRDFERAKLMFVDAIKSRMTSHTRQAQAATNRLSDRAQEANPQQAPQAPQPQNLADQNARLLQEAAELRDRQARERAELEDRLARVDAQRQAQERRDFEADRQQQVQPGEEAARQDEIRPAKEREEKAEEVPSVKDSDACQLQGFENLASEDVSLPIAFLTVGIHETGGPVFRVATDHLQQLARPDGSDPFTCLHKPGQFILPVLMGTGGLNVGEENEDGRVHCHTGT